MCYDCVGRVRVHVNPFPDPASQIGELGTNSVSSAKWHGEGRECVCLYACVCVCVCAHACVYMPVFLYVCNVMEG